MKRNKHIANIFFISVMTLLIACQPTATVKVEAPDKPIRIDLNVNIEHRVKVQIDKDLDKAIGKKEDIF